MERFEEIFSVVVYALMLQQILSALVDARWEAGRRIELANLFLAIVLIIKYAHNDSVMASRLDWLGTSPKDADSCRLFMMRMSGWPSVLHLLSRSTFLIALYYLVSKVAVPTSVATAGGAGENALVYPSYVKPLGVTMLTGYVFPNLIFLYGCGSSVCLSSVCRRLSCVQPRSLKQVADAWLGLNIVNSVGGALLIVATWVMPPVAQESARGCLMELSFIGFVIWNGPIDWLVNSRFYFGSSEMPLTVSPARTGVRLDYA